MLKSIFALFLILLLSSNSYSLVENEVVVYGQIYKYDNEFVFLKNGKKKIGEKIFAVSPLKNKNIPEEIVSSHYVDPKGERVRS